MALVALIVDLHRLLDKGRSVLLLLHDLTAALDTVNYDLLANHFANVGIHGTVLKWLDSFLKGQGPRGARGKGFTAKSFSV